MILRLARRNVYGPSQGARWLQGRDDALKTAAKLKCRYGFLVGRREEFHPAHVVEPRMFGTDAGVIKAGGDRMRLLDLAVTVHQQVGAVAVQHARPAARDGGRVLAARDAVPRRFDAVNFDRAVVEERI